QLRTSRNQSLSGLVSFVLGEVLDESGSQILCLGLPLGRICIGITRVKDVGVNTRKLGGYFDVEVRDLLGGSLQNVSVQDRIDDSAGILNGDTLSGAVPSGVNQISLGAALLHSLYQLFRILGRMQLQEGLSEAGGEGRSGLGDSALGSGKL